MKQRLAFSFDKLEIRDMLSAVAFLVHEVDSFDSIQAYAVAAGDVDQDNDIDIVARGERTLEWFENLGGHQFAEPKSIGSPSDANGPHGQGKRTILLRDMDGDNDLDVVDSSGSWFENSGKGIFSGVHQLPGRTLTPRAVTYEIADIDGDGDLDALSGIYDRSCDPLGGCIESFGLSWFKNDGRGGWTELPALYSSSGQGPEGGPYSPFARDVDGDSDLDTVVGGCLYRNLDGNGQFGGCQLTGSDYLSFGGDVDGDGDLDLLAVKFNQNEQSIHWFENTDGLGKYQEAGLITSKVNSTMDIVTADLDGDQDADVISASYWDNTVAWYENVNSATEFGDQRVLSNLAHRVVDILAIDIDGDGDQDVVAASSSGPGGVAESGGKVLLFENVGVPGDSNHDGRFDSSDLVQVFQIGEYEDTLDNNSTFEDGDWDGDGDFTSTDLVFAFQHGGYIAASLPAPVAVATDKLFERLNVRRRNISLSPSEVVDVGAAMGTTDLEPWQRKEKFRAISR